MRGGPLGHLFRPDNFVSGKGSASNNWAKARYSDGADVLESLFDSICKEAEVLSTSSLTERTRDIWRILKEWKACDRLQGFQLFHSLSGGTGSGKVLFFAFHSLNNYCLFNEGLGSLILSNLRDQYPTAMTCTCSVFPSPTISDVVLGKSFWRWTTLLNLMDCRTIQQSVDHISIDRKCWRSHLLRQRIPAQHMLQVFVCSHQIFWHCNEIFEAAESNHAIDELNHCRSNQWHHKHLQIPWRHELRPQKAGSESGSISKDAFLHSEFCTTFTSTTWSQRSSIGRRDVQTVQCEYLLPLVLWQFSSDADIMWSSAWQVLCQFCNFQIKPAAELHRHRWLLPRKANQGECQLCGVDSTWHHGTCDFRRHGHWNIWQGAVQRHSRRTETSVTFLANSSAIRQTLEFILEKASQMLKRKSYVHYFTGEGTEDGEFSGALSNVVIINPCCLHKLWTDDWLAERLVQRVSAVHRFGHKLRLNYNVQLNRRFK